MTTIKLFSKRGASTENDYHCKGPRYSCRVKTGSVDYDAKRMVLNAGIVSKEAVEILQMNGAIEPGLHRKVKDQYMYPDYAKGVRKCHLRALYNVSRRAALNAFEGELKHHQNMKVKNEIKNVQNSIIKALNRLTKESTNIASINGISSSQYNVVKHKLVKYVEEYPNGNVYRIRQQHWVSLTRTVYTDDGFYYRVLDYEKADSILTALEDPKSQYIDIISLY